MKTLKETSSKTKSRKQSKAALSKCACATCPHDLPGADLRPGARRPHLPVPLLASAGEEGRVDPLLLRWGGGRRGGGRRRAGRRPGVDGGLPQALPRGGLVAETRRRETGGKVRQIDASDKKSFFGTRPRLRQRLPVTDILTVKPFHIAVPFVTELGKESVCKKDVSKIS